MIYEIEKNVWFDADNIFIIGGKENLNNYMEVREKYPPPIKPEPMNRFPSIVFLSTTSCNLQCAYCYASQGTYNHISQSSSFQFTDYVTAYQQIVKEFGGVSSIGFFGGEPLLNFKEIKSFVEYLHENVVPSIIPLLGITSNGTIMNDEIIDFLIKYKIGFGTSLDGPKIHNDKSRFGNNIESVYDTVIDNIKRMGNREIPIAIQFTFNRTHLENYTPGEITQWASAFEELPIHMYDIISATTDNPELNIDLTDERIKENFTVMCTELADHCLDALITGRTTIIPKAFVFIFLSIANRKIATTCRAGQDITISPDLRVYPCHINASTCTKSEPCEDGLSENMQNNTDFHSMQNIKREDVTACLQCVAKNLCAVFCKGLSSNSLSTPPAERCLIMNIFLKRVISFMAHQYPLHEDRIRESIRNISNRNQILREQPM
jgi:radical SAM protein with 4Fe4S-binding SPASM domain